MKYAVIGHPIAHSKSPMIHNEWFKTYKIEGVYEAIDIDPNDLEKEITKLIDDGYQGLNVTVPHKESIIPLCHDMTETARAMGAVNTVFVRDGTLYGDNTDAYGFIANIKQKSDFNFQGKKAFVLGAGGAARAVIYGLIQEGVSHILLTNRTREKAESLLPLAPDIIQIMDWDERSSVLGSIDLLVNTTSLGMAGKTALDIDLSLLPNTALVHDIVYAPLMTDILTQAEARGNPLVTGIGMLLHQAAAAFEIWTGVKPIVSPELEKKVLA